MRVKKRKAKYPVDEDAPASTGMVAEPAPLYYPGNLSPLKLLGLESAGAGANQQEQYLKVIRGGLPRFSLDKLMDVTGLSIYELADVLDTTDRTLRRYSGEVKLSREHSERALEMARLYSQGADVFGDMDAFRQWMSTEVPALGGRKPISFLDTSLGISMLMAELVRIEHGVFA